MFLTLLLGGCVLPPADAARYVPLRREQLGLTGGAVAAAPHAWWASFDDPQLNGLIEQALANGPSMAQARARMRDAAAQTDVVRAGLLPKATLDTSLLRQHAPQNYLIPPPLAGSASWLGQGGVSLGWDLDFWGRQADALAAASDRAEAASLEVDDTRLMLAGAIAQAYVELYRSYALVDIANRAQAQRQNILEITRKRVAAGIDTRLELREAEGQLPQARVDRAEAQAAADLAAHQLATICGRGGDVYGAIKPPNLNLDAALPLPVELPVNLLARRPDILAAGSQIRAADADRLAAKAAFYPDVSLRAIAGFGAFGLDNLFSWSARGYGGGPFVSLPLFDAGKLRAQYRSREAQLDAAVDNYNLTVLQAVQQTADQITRIDSLSRERIEQQQTLEATEDAFRLGEERYRAGVASYLAVLNAETQVLAARRRRVDIMSNQVIARVTLLLAIGGSFEPPTAAVVNSTEVPDAAHSNETTKAMP